MQKRTVQERIGTKNNLKKLGKHFIHSLDTIIQSWQSALADNLIDLFLDFPLNFRLMANELHHEGHRR